MTAGGWTTYSEAEDLEGWWVPNSVTPVGQASTVVMLQEIFGVNAAMRQKATAFADAGFNVLLPDIFGRQERRVDLTYSDADRTKGFGLMQKMDSGQAVADCVKAISWARQPQHGNGKVATVGFCMGGLLAVLAAKTERVDAAISFYGVRLNEFGDAIRQVKCPLQYHVGTEDSHIGSERVEQLKQIFSELPNAQLFTYVGAKHGFFNAGRSDVFDAQAAAQAQSRTFELLRSALS